MKPLSIDLRERVVAAVDGGATHEAAARRFAVSPSSVGRLVRLRDRAGSVAPRPHAGGFASRVDAPARETLAGPVRARPDATLAELRDRLAERAGVAVTAARVCQVLGELGRRARAKKSRRRRPSVAGRTWPPPGPPGRRTCWPGRPRRPPRLVFLDEAGCNTAMAPDPRPGPAGRAGARARCRAGTGGRRR